MGKHLTEEQRQEILDLYSRLKHTKLVEEQTGHSWSQIRYTLKRAGIRPRGGRLGACHLRHAELVRMAERGDSIQEMATALGTNRKTVARYIREHQIQRPAHRQHPQGMGRNTRGPNNPAWKGGRQIDKSGYVLLWMPDHPQANRHGQVREHRIVMERKLGRPLTRHEVVDHIDGNTGNNCPSNLRLFPNNGEHLRVTMTGVPCPARGRKRKSNQRG